MANEIFMPKLSSTMEEGTILQWLKEEGDSVEIGEPLFEIMTDKINIEVESYEEGVFLKKYYEVDDVVPINTVLGYIGEPNEEVPDNPPTSDSDEEIKVEDTEPEEAVSEEKIEETEEVSGKVRATPAARRVAFENDISINSVKGSGPKGRIHEKDVYAYVEEDHILITPLAEKIAKEKGLDISKITGTGSRGKIEKSDVLHYADSIVIESSDGEAERIKVTGLRKIIGDKMVESTNKIPHVTLTSEVDMSKVMELRTDLLPVIEKQTGYRLSFTEIIVKTTAHTLKNHPIVNASLVGNEIVMNKQVNMGLAVAVDNGLIVPSIHNVTEKGLAELTRVTKTLGKKARDGDLTPAEMSGSSFTISNLGMYAIDAFSPIINPPETAILGVGRINKKPVVVDDSIEVKPMMVLSLSFDHRAFDGAPAAAFLTELKENLENPYSLLV